MLEVVIALSLAVLVGSAIAHKTRITPAIVLIFIGLAIGIMPAHELHEVQSIGLPPHVILEIFLPIMLFWEARNTSWREARNRIRGVILTGTLLVIVTAFGVAGILHELIGVSAWGAALLIGVALAPTDAVAVATLNGKLPKSSITTLKAEALINDGTTLVLLTLALQVAAGQGLSLGHSSGMFFFSFLIGILVGLAVGWVANKIRALHRQPDVVHLLHADRALHRVPARGEDRAFPRHEGLRRGCCRDRGVLPHLLQPGHHQTAEPHLRSAHLGVRHLRHERRAVRHGRRAATHRRGTYGCHHQPLRHHLELRPARCAGRLDCLRCYSLRIPERVHLHDSTA